MKPAVPLTEAAREVQSILIELGIEAVIIGSAEDLIMKAFAGRDRDFLDIEGILVRQGANLDWKLKGIGRLSAR